MRKKKLQIIKELAGGDPHPELTPDQKAWLDKRNWHPGHIVVLIKHLPDFSGKDLNFESDLAMARAIGEKIELKIVTITEHPDIRRDDKLIIPEFANPNNLN